MLVMLRGGGGSGLCRSWDDVLHRVHLANLGFSELDKQWLALSIIPTHRSLISIPPTTANFRVRSSFCATTIVSTRRFKLGNSCQIFLGDLRVPYFSCIKFPSSLSRRYLNSVLIQGNMWLEGGLWARLLCYSCGNLPFQSNVLHSSCRVASRGDHLPPDL